MRAARVCSRQGCINLVYGRGSLCVQHEQAERRRRDARNRRPNWRKSYGPMWPRTSREYLAAHPHCAICHAAADHVDHIIAVDKGGAILDWNNLQSLCKRHHSKKTASVDGGFGNPRR